MQKRNIVPMQLTPLLLVQWQSGNQLRHSDSIAKPELHFMKLANTLSFDR